MRTACLARPLVGVALLIAIPPAPAAPRAAELFPAETVGFVATADSADLADRWDRTQIGGLAADAAMRPFVEQVEARINREYGGLESRLGITLEDLRAAASGEAAVGVVKSTDKQQPGRAVALIETRGRDAEAQTLLNKIDARLVERSARKRTAGEITLYELPAEPDKKLPARTAAVFRSGGYVVAAEGQRLAQGVLDRLNGAGGASLAGAPAFVETQRRAAKAAGGADATLTWYLAPFEFQAATRTPPAEGQRPDRRETLAVLAEQGFDGITGIGGAVFVAPTPDRDFVHHTFVFAPPKPGAEGKPARERYDLAMRMLELPNAAAPLDGAAPPVEAWAPRQVATYQTTHIDLANAFEHLDTLFDAFFYKGAFETTLTGWERDYYGPKVNVRKEVIPHLGTRVVVMTDYTLPISTECERYLIAIDVTNEAALREPVNRWLQNEPGAQRKSLDGVEYWELVPEDEALAQGNLDPLADLDAPAEGASPIGEERVLQRAAVCLHRGRLVIGSDADFLRQALFGATTGQTLAASADLQAMIDALRDVAPGERCAWTFHRNDEAVRPTYELIRAGEMPKSETFFGRLLNRLLTTEEQREVDAPREQRIDGRRLPTFELARRYFGPSARSVRSEPDGWLVSGLVLNKAPGTDGPAASVARK